MTEIKACERCGRSFTRAGMPYQLSATSWQRKRFCSIRCANDHTAAARTRPPAEHFHESHRIDLATGCWLWTGYVMPNGYGQFHENGRRILAHRYSFRLHKGAIPRGRNVCHRCDVRHCVNPLHLWPGTQRQNLHDAIEKGRFSVGSGHTGAKLREADVALGRELNMSVTTFAQAYGVNGSTAHSALTGKTWRHVSPPGRVTGVVCEAA
ncbi:HNH endonuclease [Methylobacterium sp. WL7]|uniref:HNH endonuclease n=1 Tax=Methylobacterium sp. WL7 TaxID=2603900 RepID=UPI0011C98BB0|nr:HNH endonuclease [Methylobacterium sp. WL7]TXN43872.1 hypothetical protein FV233_16845 [Methylobacterium sp. WL7]